MYCSEKIVQFFFGAPCMCLVEHDAVSHVVKQRGTEL